MPEISVEFKSCKNGTKILYLRTTLEKITRNIDELQDLIDDYPIDGRRPNSSKVFCEIRKQVDFYKIYKSIKLVIDKEIDRLSKEF